MTFSRPDTALLIQSSGKAFVPYKDEFIKAWNEYFDED